MVCFPQLVGIDTHVRNIVLPVGKMRHEGGKEEHATKRYQNATKLY